jgi:endonuclease/exonuclease/phosphatase family metal-dependent hydrolase
MPLRVLTLNIWNRSGPWDERLPAIRAGIEALEPDLVGLQEVLHPRVDVEGPDQARLIAQGFGYEVAFGAAWELGGIEFGNAVLSRWPIARTETFPLPNVGTDESRCLVFAEIDAPFAKVPFFVTHLNWKLHEGHVRERQIRAVTDHVMRLAPTDGFPPILVGDFNAEPESDEIRFMRGLCSLGATSVYFGDAYGLVGDPKRGATFSRRNPFAQPLREPERRIDYVFVRGPDRAGRGEVLEAEVVLDQPFEGTFASDHFGVFATVRSEPGG